MIWYKVWRESRTRFFIGAGVIIVLCLINVLFERRLMPELVRDRPYVHTYGQYLYWKVFGGQVRGMMQTVCLLLGLGGLQRDRKQGTLGFTLALPVGRTHLIVTRAAVGLLQVVAIAVLPGLVLWGASPLVASSARCHTHFHSCLYGSLAVLRPIHYRFYAQVIFDSEYTALAVAWVAYFFYLAAARYPAFRRYPLHLGDFMGGELGHMIDLHTVSWTGVIPVEMMVGFSWRRSCFSR